MTKPADYERDLAKRLHAAAIARGKAEAELERTPLYGLPVAFRMRALSRVCLAHIKWLRIYIEACQYFDDQKSVDGVPEDVGVVAGKLTEAQRRAIVGWLREYADPNTIRAIRRKGMAVRTTLTPLGLAVRAHLPAQVPA